MDTQRAGLVAVAVAVAVGGYVHFKIWQNEYRHAPVREMFIANWVLSAVVVIALVVALAMPRLAAIALAGALAVSAGSLLAFALSRGPGVPTFHGNFKETGLETTASYVFHLGSAKVILVTEGLAAVGAALLLQRRRTAPA